MRSVSELLELAEYVYVLVRSEEIKKKFEHNAEEEGFYIVSHPEDSLYGLHKDKKIYRLGWAGHMQYHNLMIRDDTDVAVVEYSKYITGEEDFLYTKEMYRENRNRDIEKEL